MSDEKRTRGGLSVKTLLIAGAASAVAAIVIPMLWRPGTVFAAARQEQRERDQEEATPTATPEATPTVPTPAAPVPAAPTPAP